MRCRGQVTLVILSVVHPTYLMKLNERLVLDTTLCCAHAHGMHTHMHTARTRVLHTEIEFPDSERPGALRKFLSSLRNMGWNISLFNYRNHGAGAQYPFDCPSDLGAQQPTLRGNG